MTSFLQNGVIPGRVSPYARDVESLLRLSGGSMFLNGEIIDSSVANTPPTLVKRKPFSNEEQTALTPVPFLLSSLSFFLCW